MGMTTCCLHSSDSCVRVGDLAGSVNTNVDSRPFVLRGLTAKHVVERRDAVGLGRRNSEHFSNMIDAARTDPARRILKRVQRWQQEMAPTLGSRLAPAHEALGFHNHCGFAHARSRQRGIDGGSFGGGRDVGTDE
jgi:hypothetical protein